MSTISEAEVAHLAELARIALTESEIQRFASELDVIASSAAKVREVTTPDVPATSHPMPLTNVVRPDQVTATLNRDELLAQAPQAEDGMFRVPRILDED